MDFEEPEDDEEEENSSPLNSQQVVSLCGQFVSNRCFIKVLVCCLVIDSLK